MNPLAFTLMSLFLLSLALKFASATTQNLSTLSHSFQNQFEECPTLASAYWNNEQPSVCIPPPMDAGSFIVPSGGAPPALCLLSRGLQNGLLGIQSPRGEVLSCQYF